MKRPLLLAFFVATFVTGNVTAQSDVAAEPVVGLRDNRPTNYALVHARVVSQPGVILDDATVLIAGTSITSVGTDVQVPPGFMVIDCSARTVYPGLIDAWSEVDVEKPSGDTGYWNRHVTPQRTARSAATKVEDIDKLRSQGITARLVAPKGGIVKGSSSVVLLGDSSAGRTLFKTDVWQHLQLSVPRGPSGSKYPNSPMGAVALLRQAFYDAQWYTDAWNAYRAKPDLPRPETNLALETLADAVASEIFVIDAPNERMAVRAEFVAQEFALKLILRGSGREYRALNEIAEMRRPILVPVDFPDAPHVADTAAASNVSLQNLMHWDLAPENPAMLAGAGISICLTTDGLDNVNDFLKQVRKSVDRGLGKDDALAAMTTTPAELLGVSANMGRVRAGMLANLVITDGDLFLDDTKVLQTWIAGQQFVIDELDQIALDQLAGTWQVSFNVGPTRFSGRLEFDLDKDRLSGALLGSAPQKGEEKDPLKAKLTELLRERDRLTAIVELDQLNEKLPGGKTRLSVVTVSEGDAGKAPEVFARLSTPDGATVPIRISKAKAKPAEKNEDDKGETKEPESPSEEQIVQPAATPLLTPLGAYGRVVAVTDTPTIMFRKATVWTCDGQGVLEEADVLIRDGIIMQVGANLAVPENCQIVDTGGKHITPGLIDCHSHMGTDGGVNESGQAVTAEVRIGDFIDNSDITIYRQLAGGLTTANILHGSANPIGGQNQVIKLRWGESMDGLRMNEAPGGIKFALGENVKRNQSRYPNTRMGVEQIIRDQLLGAREYDATWRRWRQGDRTSLPPRIDLQMEALAEVQRGERWIHCHSYRQDEIVATLDVLEEFGIQIGTLQHILEGYKVADRMARHGAMGSAFSDWWAYKFEVFDAIPYNGALMHNQGVVVSFNSDNRELGRHLNTEAAKATKYGGVPAEEALKFVTLNPAKQLRIDAYVGSITPGKHADLVVWSGRPLSTTTRCEQTWIDGRRYFDLDSDREMRARDQQLRAALIQRALTADDEAKNDDEVDEEDRWARHDMFCGCNRTDNNSRGRASR